MYGKCCVTVLAVWMAAGAWAGPLPSVTLAKAEDWAVGAKSVPIALAAAGDALELTITGPGPASRHVNASAKLKQPLVEGGYYRVSVTAKSDAPGSLRFGYDSGRRDCQPHYYRMHEVKLDGEWRTFAFVEKVPSKREYPAIAFGETRPTVGLVTGQALKKAWIRDYRLERIAPGDMTTVSQFRVPPCIPEYTGAPDRKGNLLANSSFELGVAPAGVYYTSDFSSDPAKPKVELDTTTAAHGLASVKMSVPAGCRAELRLPMPLFTPESEPGSKVYSFSLSLKSDAPRGVWVAMNDSYVDPRIMDGEWVSRAKDFRVGTDWRRFAFEKFSIESIYGRVTPKVAVTGPATLWVDAVQFEKTPDGKATDYAPAAPVEAAFSLQSLLHVAGERDAKVRLAAISYDDCRAIDLRTGAGTLRGPLEAGAVFAQELPLDTSRNGVFSLAGEFDAEGIRGKVYPVDYAVAPEVPPYRGGFFLGLNGCTKTAGGGADWKVRFNSTLDQSLDDNYRDLRRYGMRMIRLHDDGMSMRNYTAAPGKYDFAALDVVIEKAHKYGLEPMFVFGSHGTFLSRRWNDEALTNWYFRAHAKCLGTGCMGNRPYFAPDEREWTDFIAATVRHCKGRLKWYEIVNEPNITVYSAEVYARYLALAYDTIKAIDPDAKVVGICSTGDFGHNTGKFVEKAGALGAFGKLDVLSFHPYDAPVDAIEDDGERQAYAIRDLCEKYRPGLPFLQDEIYYLTYMKQGRASAAGMKDAVQAWWWPAGHLPRRYAIDLAAGALASAPLSGGQHYMGDAGQRGTRYNAAWFMPNDRFVASAAFAAFLEGGKPFGKPRTLPHGVNGFVFLDRDGREVGMLWAREKAFRRTMKRPAGVAAFDLFGNALEGDTLELTENPLYFKGTDLKAKLAFPAGVDGTPYAWRGLHLDESRHFFGKETVKKVLDRMQKEGFNVFHWHLTDDHGWRIPIRKYPELTDRGAQRKLVKDWKPQPYWFDARTEGTYGPYFYTREDIREIVAYARERGIRVVPEVDMPGHSLAALACYPDLCCFPEEVRGDETFLHPTFLAPGRNKRTYCLGNDKVQAFLRDVLDEVCELFPDEVVHIGGDEAPTTNWKECPKCQARMKALGLKDEKALQGWFMNRMIEHLAKRGKRAMGWEEITMGRPDPKTVIAQCWHNPKTATEVMSAGYEAVLSPTAYCYLDFAQGIPGDPLPYFGKSVITLEKAKAFDPMRDIPEELRGRVLGGECCNWTECTVTPEALERKMWPRAAAIAAALRGKGDAHAGN